MDFPTYLRGAMARLVLCLGVIAFGLSAGAGGAVLINQLKPYPVYAASAALSHKPKLLAKVKLLPASLTVAKHLPSAPTVVDRIRMPLTLLGSIGLVWILGAPLALGSLKKGAFMGLALGVLLMSSWTGSNAAIHTIRSRAPVPDVKAKATPVVKIAKATQPSSKSAGRRSRPKVNRRR